SCFNKAFSVNKETVNGLYPSFKINYASVMLSSGNLPNAGNIKTSSPKPGYLLLSWNTERSPRFSALGADQVFIALYCEDLERWFCHFNSTRRDAGSCSLDLSDFKGRQVQAYMGFIAENGKKASNSLYLGKLNIS
ncbi:MAG: DUF6266 family protein, partial [Bacteroidota bacterium]|nr:DUF6266 family protein [Bacteroidota bacterium]